MNSYLNRLVLSKKTLLILILIFLFPLIDIIMLVNNFSGNNLVSYLAAFLAGSSEGHLSQIILIWFLPIYLLIMCGDNYIQDIKTGYRYIVITKKGRKSYYNTMLLGNMLFAFIVILVSLIVNLILTILLFKNGTFDKGLTASPTNLAEYALIYPILTNVLYIVLFSIYASICCGFSTVICWLFPDVKYAYPICFFIWYSQILGGLTSMAMIFQPFNEITFDGFINVITRTMLLFISIILVGYIFKVKSNEI